MPTPYGQAALTGELDKLARAVQGERNQTLNNVWFKIVQLFEPGHLDRDQAYQAVYDAARNIGLGDTEVRKTMQSGERGGTIKPRVNIPEPGAPPDLTWLDLPRQATNGVPTPAPTQVPASTAMHDYSDLYLGIDELDRLPSPAPLIDGVLDERTLFSISGRGGTYKSFLAFDWLASLSSGKDWLGRPVKQRKVLYVVGEGAYGLQQRRDAWQAAWDTQLDPAWFTVRRAPVNLFTAGPAYVDLATRVQAEGYQVIVFDTLQRNTAGAEANSAKDAGRVVEHLAGIRDLIDGTVGVVAHLGKAEELGTRGSSAWEDDLDMVWRVKRTDEEDGPIGTVRAQLAKRKDGEEGLQLMLRPRLVEGTGSLVLEVPGMDFLADAHPRYSLDVLQALTGPLAVDGLSGRRVMEIAGITSFASLKRAADWLLGEGMVTSEGKNTAKRLIATSYGLRVLRESAGGVVQWGTTDHDQSGAVGNSTGQALDQSGAVGERS